MSGANKNVTLLPISTKFGDMRNMCHSMYLFDLVEVMGHTLVYWVADSITLLLVFDKWNECPLKHVWGADHEET